MGAVPAGSFATKPHRTFLGLAAPVAVALVAEPLVALVDTAFVARLGAAPLAGLGAGTALLSAALWVFNFLGVGTQTEVARCLGADDAAHAGENASAALWLAAGLGALVALLLLPAIGTLAEFMGTRDEAYEATRLYLGVRLVGAPAVLVTIAGFGTLRGLQDMRTPLYIALFVNAVNLVLDPLLIFGAGPIPSLGVAGAAWASVISQWIGVAWVWRAVAGRLPLPAVPRGGEIRSLLRIGLDVALRTGALLLFLLLATRAANQLGEAAGGAHQAIRSIWVFSAFLLDAYAHAAQTLIGYFDGRGARRAVLSVARIACLWSLATGTFLAVTFIAFEEEVRFLLVPSEAYAEFATAWWIACLQMPINALVFATDGIHWGARDYAYLRNSMLVALLAGAASLAAFAAWAPSLASVWWATALWISLRAIFGLSRIWPGWGHAPLRSP
jgi:MATE family multidrug resistance protein